MTSPDWLTQHGGEARASKNGLSLTAYVGGQPQYLLEGCSPRWMGSMADTKVVQSNNGKRLDGGAAFPTTEAAFQGGLDDLSEAARLVRPTPPPIRPA